MQLGQQSDRTRNVPWVSKLKDERERRPKAEYNGQENILLEVVRYL